MGFLLDGFEDDDESEIEKGFAVGAVFSPPGCDEDILECPCFPVSETRDDILSRKIGHLKRVGEVKLKLRILTYSTGEEGGGKTTDTRNLLRTR